MGLLVTSDEIDFAKYRHESAAYQNVRGAEDYIQDMIDNLGKTKHDPGENLPWGKLNGLIKLRPGDVSLWVGQNGAGKSLITGMVSLDLSCCQRSKTCIASFEMKPHKTLERMSRQWIGGDMSMMFGHGDSLGALRDVYSDFMTQAKGYLWMYDHQGSIDADQMISVARYCAKELGIQHLFIDSLMKCVKGEDDFNGQKDFVSELCTIAMDYGNHIHLIHHTRKTDDDNKQPQKMDIKGSGAISDLVSNVFLFWRNRADKEKRKPNEPDARIICAKQRHGDWEGAANLWYHADSQQYLPEPDSAPIDWTKRVM